MCSDHGVKGVPSEGVQGAGRYDANLHHVVEMQDESPVAGEMQDV